MLLYQLRVELVQGVLGNGVGTPPIRFAVTLAGGSLDGFQYAVARGDAGPRTSAIWRLVNTYDTHVQSSTSYVTIRLL